MRNAILAAVIVLILPAALLAQTGSGLFPTAGQPGGRAATNPTPNQASSQNAAQSAAQTGTGAGTTGSSTTIGQGTTGTLGAASGQTLLDSSVIGTNTFTGRAANAGFVGNAQVGQQQANMNAFNQMFQGLQRGGNADGRATGQPDAERFQIRPTLRVGFDYTPVTATASITNPKFVTRFSGITQRRPQLAGVNISSDDEGRVVLRGTVANEDSKSLAAALLRFEPGVREVVNELTVAPPAAP
ncbi:MAG: BON domain-containing protein [Planctomycetaceae bacterium]|nr:BON domain-containing protein [Planctomycetaceae bacterium]